MKTTTHKNLEIENFEPWYRTIHKQHPEILGAEWNKEQKILKIFYQDEATELTEETLKNLTIPTVLRFRKKVVPPKIDVADTTVTAIGENEFVVETFTPQLIREEVKKKYSEFEEVSQQ